ncbi:MAG TPA: NrsF family protein [Myxococcota bacterium]|nr:NrsF family protein [Myxococcota bacterium]
MSRAATDQLIAALAQDARPVAPVHSLRWEVAAVAAVTSALSFALLEERGLRPPGLELLRGPTPFALVAFGLALAGFGAVTAALAFARPGQERTGWRAVTATVLGLLVSVGAASLVLLRSPLGSEAVWGGLLELPCVLVSIALSVPATLFVTYLAASTAPIRPRATAFLASCGATALGTFAAHLTCRTPGAWHVVTTHAATPLLGGFLLAVPALRLLRSRARSA